MPMPTLPRSSSRRAPGLAVAAFLVLALAMALGPAAPAAAQAPSYEAIHYPPLPELEIPHPERVVLDNGLVVMLLEDHELPLVDAAVMVRTGERWEPTDRLGLAGLTGEVLRTGGTESMSADELDDWLEAKAASIESSTDTDSGRVRMSCLTEDFAEVLGVFADVLRRPAFAADRLEVARTQLETRIARQNDNPQGILFREIAEIVYGANSPYARFPTYETAAAIDRDALVAWHHRWYHPDRMILGIVGDFERDRALELVRAEFGDWARGPALDEPEAGWSEQPSPGIYHVTKDDITQSNIAMAHLGIRQDDPDYYAVEVFNNVLSGSASSRLFSEVRTKKGLAYAVRGTVGADFDHPGLTMFWMTTKTESTAAGIEALRAEADAILGDRPATDEEVAKAKESILNSFVFNFDSTAEILRQQMTYEYYGYPLDRMERYQAGIEAVTPDDVRRAAEKHLHPERFAVLVVGPGEGLDKPLSTFGEVQVVDVTIPTPEVTAVEATAEGLERGGELIALAVEALGGAEAVDGMQALEREMTLQLMTPQGMFNVPARSVIAFPDRMRQEMSTPAGEMVFAVAGDRGWASSPQGVFDLPAAQLQEVRERLERDLLVILRGRGEPGFEAAAVGTEEVGEVTVEQVQVRSGELVTTLGIDPESGRVLLQSYRGAGPGGAPAEVVYRFSDFRPAGDLVYPFTVERLIDGEPAGGAAIENVVVDPPLDEMAFSRPTDGDDAGSAAE